AHPDGSFVPLIVALALIGAGLSFAVNFLVLKAAFLPLLELERTVEEVRRGNLQARASPGLFPDPHIEQLAATLNALLGHAARDHARKGHTRVEFRALGLGPEDRLPAEAELVLYRIVQEALTNIARHADAATATVTLERLGGAVVATVEDDGRGFDPGTVYQE